ncbi:MAG: putative toxin-antitoxin system toxin component, PIN family [Paludibacteraceae bacterium]|nr:putative toxin-antitoxin system toxin component, PIN family [Paludibacteraceae bacterium]
MVYAVFDTNVLVSALLSKSADSTISLVIKHFLEGDITPLYSDDIISEYKEVLSRPKFHFLPELCETLVNRIINQGINSERTTFDGYLPDESDRIFYEIALSNEDAYLVTGNLKHFPVTPIVVTPAEMLDILLGKGRHSSNNKVTKK